MGFVVLRDVRTKCSDEAWDNFLELFDGHVDWGVKRLVHGTFINQTREVPFFMTGSSMKAILETCKGNYPGFDAWLTEKQRFPTDSSIWKQFEFAHSSQHIPRRHS